jgi:hypothetical protein
VLEILVAISLSAVNSYHIGNSLMLDGLGNSTGSVQNGVFGLEQMGRNYGYSYSLGLHIDTSRQMHVIWEDPAGVDFSRTPYGRWDNALANYHWDHVLFEPYLGEDNTLGLDKEMIGNFIDYTRSNPQNQDTIFYVYQVWPRQSWSAGVGSYYNYWTYYEPSQVNDEMLTRPMRPQYDFLMDWAQDTYAPQGILVRTVPNGEVWNEVILAIDAGEIPGLSNPSELYRDDLHGSGTIGRYLAAATNFATMFQTNPMGMVPPIGQFGMAYPQSVYDKLNEIIWEVVSSNPHTGLADFNDDGYVSQADLTLWRNSYGVNAAADADGDGDSDGRDFLVLQRAFQGLAALSAVTVPEPGTALLLATSLSLFCTRRIRS